MSIEFPVGKDYENGSIKDVLHDLGFHEDGRAFSKDGRRYSYEGCDKYQSYIFSVTMNPLK
ncbi:hypothetical protein [Gottfriedia luciferensis]|uniref:hypothetical protein n=1 Tax=Gottfriedia luciferensis TaxID=178774 RepID=UPI000B437D3B|nr:hypothetical protein [Gottfriedia luciferensis]